MNTIRFVFYSVLYMMPGLILSGIILWIFPNTPYLLLSSVTIGIVLGAFLVLRNKEKVAVASAMKNEKSDETYSKVMGFCLLVGTFAASTGMFFTNKTSFYIDNGSDKDIVVTIKNNGTFTIKSNEYKELRISMGKTEVEYNGIKKIFDINARGQWVWNVDNWNQYKRDYIAYSSVEHLEDASTLPDSEETIQKELFVTHVDYMFQPPTQITVEGNALGNERVLKTVLYRSGNSFIDIDEKAKEDTLNSINNHK